MPHSAENVARDVTVTHGASRRRPSRAFATFGARLSAPLTLTRLVLDDATIRGVLCHSGGAYSQVGGSLAEVGLIEKQYTEMH